GSLRQAILNANANWGRDTITFNVCGTINLSSPLPAVTDPVVIDGTTAPGYAGRPCVELNGAGAGPNANRLTINASHSTVKGLVLNRFTTGTAVCVNSIASVIQNNFIGTNVAGTAALGNFDGITITGTANTVGGTAAGAGNLISGNNRYGVAIVGSSSTGNQ